MGEYLENVKYATLTFIGSRASILEKARWALLELRELNEKRFSNNSKINEALDRLDKKTSELATSLVSNPMNPNNCERCGNSIFELRLPKQSVTDRYCNTCLKETLHPEFSILDEEFGTVWI